MKGLNVSEFKRRIAAYLREVERGETLIITEHRRPIAEVRRIDGGESLVLPAHRAFSLEGCTPSRPQPGLAIDLLDADREGR